MENKVSKTRRLTESAMLLALAVVLEFVSKMFIPEMPFGGQVTLVSMLPVVLISYRHGMKWGFFAAFTGSISAVPRSWPRHSSASGQASHRGVVLGPQTVAPSSISA